MMYKHCSPAKRLRSYKRLVAFILKKPKPCLSITSLSPIDITPARKMLSITNTCSTSVMPSTSHLSFSKSVVTDTPPDSQNKETKHELEAKIITLQSTLVQVKHLYSEMLKVKDENIDFLKNEIANLPAILTSQLKEQLHLQLQPH